ncbi:MAG: hypothetical protein ACR2KX_19530 [Chitinophagaceae bacterium]
MNFFRWYFQLFSNSDLKVVIAASGVTATVLGLLINYIFIPFSKLIYKKIKFNAAIKEKKKDLKRETYIQLSAIINSFRVNYYNLLFAIDYSFYKPFHEIFQERDHTLESIDKALKENYDKKKQLLKEHFEKGEICKQLLKEIIEEQIKNANSLSEKREIYRKSLKEIMEIPKINNGDNRSNEIKTSREEYEKLQTEFEEMTLKTNLELERLDKLIDENEFEKLSTEFEESALKTNLELERLDKLIDEEEKKIVELKKSGKNVRNEIDAAFERVLLKFNKDVNNYIIGLNNIADLKINASEQVINCVS